MGPILNYSMLLHKLSRLGALLLPRPYTFPPLSLPIFSPPVISVSYRPLPSFPLPSIPVSLRVFGSAVLGHVLGASL